MTSTFLPFLFTVGSTVPDVSIRGPGFSGFAGETDAVSVRMGPGRFATGGRVLPGRIGPASSPSPCVGRGRSFGFTKALLDGLIGSISAGIESFCDSACNRACRTATAWVTPLC